MDQIVEINSNFVSSPHTSGINNKYFPKRSGKTMFDFEVMINTYPNLYFVLGYNINFLCCNLNKGIINYLQVSTILKKYTFS